MFLLLLLLFVLFLTFLTPVGTSVGPVVIAVLGALALLDALLLARKTRRQRQGQPEASQGKAPQVRLWRGTTVILASVGLCATWGAPLLGHFQGPPEVAFSGDSADLEHTVVVPTLDTPMPPGKNVVWCASFQLAWNSLIDDVLKAPVKLGNAPPAAERLNAAAGTPPELPDGAYYAKAGELPDVLPVIRNEMARQFPHKRVDIRAGGLDQLLAYAYLEVQGEFPIPYKKKAAGMTFTGNGGGSAKVGAFGLPEPVSGGLRDTRRQCEVLFREHTTDQTSLEFAVNLHKDGEVEVILAAVTPGDTLAATWESIRARSGSEELKEDDILLVPEMNWRIAHHFSELEGPDKVLLNALEAYPAGSLFLSSALQETQFILDRHGVDLRSEAQIFMTASIPRRFVFDRPFFLALRHKDAEQPFFAVWIDNAELLSPN